LWKKRKALPLAIMLTTPNELLAMVEYQRERRCLMVLLGGVDVRRGHGKAHVEAGVEQLAA
jgi:hypothetical protein